MDPQRQAIVTLRLRKIHDACNNGSALPAVEILDRVWELRGGEGRGTEIRERLDWPVIAETIGKGHVGLF